MANANHALLSLCCLLLAVAGALAATTPTEANKPADPLARNNGPTPTGPMLPLPPAAVACWKSILDSRDCVNDILQSLTRLELRISKVCCSVLEKIGERCVVDAFSNFPFNPLFPPFVKQACSRATD